MSLAENIRILVVDDDMVSREKLAAILSPFGSCETAADGLEAVEILQKSWEQGHPFDVVSLDYSMPGINGLEVLKMLRKMEKIQGFAERKKSLVIMVSSLAEKKTMVDCIEAGCDDYMFKPFYADEISVKMRVWGLAPHA